MTIEKTLTGAAVRRIRTQLGLTQQAFAARLRLHPNSLAKIERNLIRMRPATSDLIRHVAADIQSEQSSAGPPERSRAIRLRDR
jgi:transcriptional regulator with XRE-family HTH domain